ncbi:pyrimidine dimer DNA glycosylase/endonuclease V [Pseudoclavibacter endophyticus]|uniref:Pyrimidine dimer DNA glycosylase n=1 Tax=Pseudoclavibacter endophyticus TaxID=1778590 RepID=A0A6H9WWJ8_9MICO|nr:pyrimidine dimer DNA glycosylase/endonuclease V [Pseudoclavibacter endophyticus]KAB1650560.1 pyrimidine dimer DNA glycosylase [Pseudoclavibacter endophyticus]
MRLWSLHPQHLDRAGLVAGWREALLAQAVLAGRTKGYRHHPQLVRFTATPKPLESIGAFLSGLRDEAELRGYQFDASRILEPAAEVAQIPVTQGQITFEWHHLGKKLMRRSPEDAHRWEHSGPSPHPLFIVVSGEMERWERP